MLSCCFVLYFKGQFPPEMPFKGLLYQNFTKYDDGSMKYIYTNKSCIFLNDMQAELHNAVNSRTTANNNEPCDDVISFR